MSKREMQYWKNEILISPELFHILGAQIIFWPNVDQHYYKLWHMVHGLLQFNFIIGP